MTSWKVHIVFNLIFMVLFVLFLTQIGIIKNILVSISILVFSSLAAIIPDIDSNKSKIRDKFALLVAGIIIIYLVMNLSVKSIIAGIVGFLSLYLILRFLPTKHRGVTHKLWFGLFFSLISSVIMFFAFNSTILEFVIFFLAIFFGYFSHIVLDKVS